MNTILAMLYVLSLGDPAFPEREKAQHHLAAVMADAEPVVRWGVAHPDAEVSARCVSLLRDYWQATAAAKATKVKPTVWAWDRLPWLDSLPEDYPGRAETLARYLDLARETKESGDQCPPEWPDYNRATLLFLTDLFRDGATESEVVDLLNKMAAWEHAWRVKYAPNYAVSGHVLPVPTLKAK